MGVANDAVNFLNSAVGSRVASARIILTVASAGILLGVLTSDGLLDVARSGVFDPSWFTDADGRVRLDALLAVYLGVMAADVLLLELFNSFGLPTSTTVSIISELMGASVAVALWLAPEGAGPALGIINTGPVLGIYGAIFLSVVVAFTVSATLMFLLRLLYGHDLGRSFPRLGWLWVGASGAALGYFVVIKGLGSSGLLSPSRLADMQAAVPAITGGTFAVCAALAILLRNRPRAALGGVILAGTAALGLSFAGNDLVNFIGPAVAGLEAVAAGGDLSGGARVPPWVLLAAGAVMVAALWRSRKAARVTDTEVRLAAHGATPQRFSEASPLAHALVRSWLATYRAAGALVPGSIRRSVRARVAAPASVVAGDAPYDLLRASVNLVTASLLISLGTASGLPLSTTYITFMCAMGAALGDHAWSPGRAPQRVTGILVVLGGWLVTGLLAALGAFVMASLISLGGTPGIAVALLAVGAGVWRLRRVGSPVEDGYTTGA